MILTTPPRTGHPLDEAEVLFHQAQTAEIDSSTGPPDADLLFKEAKQRERRRRLLVVVVILAACLVALAAVVAAGGLSSPRGAVKPRAENSSSIATNPQTHEYQLPTDGWKPGDGSLLMGIRGPFHAILTTSGACAWFGPPNQGTDYLWPAGYQVRFNPTELIDPSGHVVARQGQMINGGGGGYTRQEALSLHPPPVVPNYCGPAEVVVNIESLVLKGSGPA
jgi:hypothetical protein